MFLLGLWNILTTNIALIFFYGAILVSYEGFTVNSILTVFSMLLFSIGYAGTVLSWSKFHIRSSS